MEIEVKVKIDDLPKLKKDIENLGAGWSETKIQVDAYFKRKEDVDSVQRPGSFILRVRRDSKAKLTFKAFTDRRGVWEELETTIDDPGAMEKILEKSGFVNVLTLHKRRTSTKYQQFSLEIDEIEELGDFLEAEVMGEDGEKLQEEIKQFFLSLGLSPEKIDRRGYPEMIFESQGQKFEGQS